MARWRTFEAGVDAHWRTWLRKLNSSSLELTFVSAASPGGFPPSRDARTSAASIFRVNTRAPAVLRGRRQGIRFGCTLGSRSEIKNFLTIAGRSCADAMAILAHLEPTSTPRGSQRRKLRLQAVGRGAPDAQTRVVIHNMSLTGLLLESSEPLPPVLDVEVPGTNPIEAAVVWNSGFFFGCRFRRPISQAVLSAALLRAEPAEEMRATSTEESHPASFASQLKEMGARLDRMKGIIERAIETLAAELEPATTAAAHAQHLTEVQDEKWPLRWRLRVILVLALALWGAVFAIAAWLIG